MNSAADLVLVARVAGSLLVVLVVVALSARLARKAKFGRSVAGIRVLERTGLTRDASVAVVEIADQALVLGVTPHGVTVLTVLDGDRLTGDRSGGDRSTDDDAPRRRGRGRRGRAAAAERAVAAERATGAADPAPDAAGAFAAALADAGADGGVPAAFPAEGIPLPGGERLSAEDFGRIVEEAGQRLFGGGRGSDRDAGVLPDGVRLDQYPDLASALRAAGRVQQPARNRPQPAQATRPAQPAQAARPAQAAQPARPAQPAQAAQAARPARAAKPAVPRQTTGQASGSVLDPATWRQGIEALRDLTARKG